jgi:predicted DNA-binding transcriptional regulator AlpA
MERNRTASTAVLIARPLHCHVRALEEDTMTKKKTPVAAPEEEAKPVRLINRAEVVARTGLHYQTIWNYMRDATFPLARAVGGKSLWLEREVDEWIEARPKRHFKSREESARDALVE